MEKKTKKLEELVAGAGKNAKNLLNSAVQAIDQNDDGKINFADATVLAGAMGDAVRKGALTAKENAGEAVKALTLKTLRPIFPDSLSDADFLMPKFIRIVERDKKFVGGVCQGSIGYESDQKGLYIVNIFQDSIDAFGLLFYPDRGCEFYYVDPSDRDRYIALDEYFGYLKIARINELKKIAQDLGAKHFKVTYREEQALFTQGKVNVHAKANVKVAGAGTVDGGHGFNQKKYAVVDVAAEMIFPGHAPIRPQLKYLQRDPSIQTLIAMRMDENAPLLHEKYMLKMSNSSGIKENDAVKIDSALKALKFAGNATVVSEVKNESRRYLEYDIEF